MRLKPAGASWSQAAALTALAQQRYGAITPMLSGSATIAGDSVAAAQLLFGAQAIPPWSNRMVIDAGLITALYGIAAGDRGQSVTIYARQHVLTSRGGYWIGGGYSSIDRTSNFRSNEVNAAAWLQFGGFRVTGVVSTTRTNDREVFNATKIPAKPFAQTVRVGDATMQLELTDRRLEAELMAGARVGLEGSSGSAGFGNASVGWKVTPRISLLVGGGSRFADPLRGTPEWRFASFGIRIKNGAGRPIVAPNHVGPPLSAARIEDGMVLVIVDALPGVRSVEIAGTFTGWEPVSLSHASGTWSVSLSAKAGAHQVQVRVDGGDWHPPVNLSAVADEYGQRAGLIIIP